MPTKTDRIISYLPGTFRALPRSTALYALLNAFGSELQQGENSLAALMQAHWVDHADRNTETLHDLLMIASMYGLKPRADEDVQTFRKRLKQYIRIFLEGTTTVQGILRVTAHALGVDIADDYKDMDTWWTRDSDAITQMQVRPDDATQMLFGSKRVSVTGKDAQAAQIIGSVALRGGIDLRKRSILKLKVDKNTPVKIDFSMHSDDPESITLEQIIQVINETVPGHIASAMGQYLILTSPTTGRQSKLELLESEYDAGSAILGVAPKTWRGKDIAGATVSGLIDLENGVDLSEHRYLRLVVDNSHLLEIDCSGAHPENTTLDDISDAINTAFGFPLASHNGHVLTLTSASLGSNSSISFLQAAAQDAKSKLFGAIDTSYSGHEAQAALATGIRDLSKGVDLSENFNILIEMDNINPITINCAGVNPEHTQLPEIVAAINEVLGAGVARHNGRFINVQAETLGSKSYILFGIPENDATELLFGISGRVYTGKMATAAHFIGKPVALAQTDFCEAQIGCVDISTVRFISLVIDDRSPIRIDLAEALWQEGKKPRHATLINIAEAINETLGDMVTLVVDDHLEWISPSTGSVSKVCVETLKEEQLTRFVTRARLTGEVSEAVFGFTRAERQGEAAIPAQLVGTRDLRHGINLSDSALLRLKIDNGAAVEVNCAGKRPRATLIDEIVANINTAIGGDEAIASHDGRHLILNSPSNTANSEIAFEAPRSTDATATLLGVETGIVRGSEASSVTFVGTVAIATSLDLSSASHIKLSIDDGEAVEIDCAGINPAATRLNEIIIAINLALGKAIASRSGERIALSSPTTGADSRIEFALPDASDATLMIFGILAPRQYQGVKARPAKIYGRQDLSADVDLQTARYLKLSVDGSSPIVIDCANAAEQEDTVSLTAIIAAINDVTTTELGVEIASEIDGKFLVLTSSTVGFSSRMGVEYHTGADARTLLFGEAVAEITKGVAAKKASLVGDIDLLSPIDLSARSTLRLSVNGGLPEDIRLAGGTPKITHLDEIIAAINAVFPNLASRTEDDRLLLTSSEAGESSRLSLLPSRHLELIEYPPQPQQFSKDNIGHASHWIITNQGISDVPASVQLTTQTGVSGASLINLTTGQRLFFPIDLRPFASLTIRLDKMNTLQGVVGNADGGEAVLSQNDMIVSQPHGGMQGTDNILNLTRGKSRWVYTECIGSRFDDAIFDQNRFAGGECHELGIFNISRFADELNVPKAEFSAKDTKPAKGVTVKFDWVAYQAGAFRVNLPADLPACFGGRFNEARFAQPQDKPEEFLAAVTEPDTDPMFIGNLFEQGLEAKVLPSKLVRARRVSIVPLAWEPIPLPFRKPVNLTLGSEQRPAKIYLSEKGLSGFIEIEAIKPGDWGNAISLAARSSGPAMFDIAVFYQGATFENARQTVLGTPLHKLTAESLKPNLIGVLQAKATGVHTEVTRDNT